MAVVFSSLAAGGSVATQSSLNTSSISPTANRLVIITVQSHKPISGTPNAPTLSGAGMTWVQIATRAGVSDVGHRITMFRGLSSSPGSGAITIDFGGQNQDQIDYTIDQATGMVTSGSNGADAIVQSASNDASPAASLTVTLAAFASKLNATYGACAVDNGGGVTKGANFTELSTFSTGVSIESEYAQTNQTSVNWTAGSGMMIAMAVEVKAAVMGGFFELII